MVALAEWFGAHEIPFTLLDLDTENKARGCPLGLGLGKSFHSQRWGDWA
jgi:hypothetical protein